MSPLAPLNTPLDPFDLVVTSSGDLVLKRPIQRFGWYSGTRTYDEQKNSRWITWSDADVGPHERCGTGSPRAPSPSEWPLRIQ